MASSGGRSGSLFPPVSRAGCSTAVTLARSLRFQPPPPRTVHAVLPHTAHRRRSPPAFGFTRQSRKGLGATTIPDKVISPSWFGDWQSDHRPAERAAAAVPFADEQRQPHPRVAPDLVEAGRGVAVPEVGGPAAQEPVQVLHDPLRRQQQPGPVRSVPGSGRGRAAWPCPRASGPGTDPAFPVRPRERTSRWWKPRKSKPPPPSSRCTMRVLAAFGSRPRLGQQGRQPLQRLLGLAAGPAHHHQVVGDSGPAPRRRRPMPGPAGAGRRCT